MGGSSWWASSELITVEETEMPRFALDRHPIRAHPPLRWYRILSHALVKYLKGRQLDPARRLQAA